jgi:hypothetical protein
MSWADRIGDAIATFRGIDIVLENTSQSPGRRVQVHEYPLRDQPYAEDLGLSKREWQIDGFLIGPDYDQARQRLVEAAEQAGAAELVHPYYGTHRVVIVGGIRIRESTREGGLARVSFTVFRADVSRRSSKALPQWWTWLTSQSVPWAFTMICSVPVMSRRSHPLWTLSPDSSRWPPYAPATTWCDVRRCCSLHGLRRPLNGLLPTMRLRPVMVLQRVSSGS